MIVNLEQLEIIELALSNLKLMFDEETPKDSLTASMEGRRKIDLIKMILSKVSRDVENRKAKSKVPQVLKNFNLIDLCENCTELVNPDDCENINQ